MLSHLLLCRDRKDRKRQKLHKGQEDGKKAGSEKDKKKFKKMDLFKKNLREGVKRLINKAKKEKSNRGDRKTGFFGECHLPNLVTMLSQL